jgi:DEAD/DEAH box helicase domain-containing protein
LTRAFFDIETRCLASELGDGSEGWKALLAGEGGISVACVVLEYEDSSLVRVFDDHTVERLAMVLEAADEVVTFNGTHFDVPVVEAVLGRSLELQAHVDLKKHLGGSLNRNAWKLLGRGKSGRGEDAPALLREGRIGELVNYCLDDAYLTRDVWREWVAGGCFDACGFDPDVV